MQDTEYAHLTGRIRGMEARMLSMGQLGRMAEAATPADLFRQLAETDYRPAAEAQDIGMVDQVLGGVYAEIRALSPHPAPVDLFEWDRRFAVARARVRRREPLNGELPAEVADGVRDLVAQGLPIHVVDTRLDQERFRLMAGSAGATGSEFLRDLVALWADLTNLQAMLRAKLLGRRSAFLTGKLVPGGREAEVFLRAIGEAWEQLPRLFAGTGEERVAARAAEEAVREGALPSLGKTVDDALTGFARAARRVAMGPEAVSGHLWGREVEARNLRLIFQGVTLGVGPEQIRGRLREPYA
ncbi:MAG: V-type ATPase subunit [bacterium]|nr:V-type ATPase subunit [bacterium]